MIEKIDKDTNLLIIVDSSSNSTEACRYISEELGIDVVIIDHHQIDVENPYATVVNCQMGDYPNKHLSGSAMVYKVCQVIDEYIGENLADMFLDLTAIGLIGDMMDVKNMENRYLIYNGINKIENMGIKEILRQSGIDYNDGLSTTNISFKVSPIIGACSRFDKIELALELLTSRDLERAVDLTKKMINLNEERKVIQKEIVANAKYSTRESDNIVIYIDNEVGSGFTGLIATEFVETYGKPSFVLSFDGEEYRGSARGIGSSVPLKSFCQKSGLFSLTQGHEEAFGVGFKKENFDAIIDYFNTGLKSDDLVKVVEYDLELNINDIDEMDIKQIEKFSKVSGMGFPEPKFLIKGITVEEGYTKKLGNHVRAVLGKNNDTIKINCENGIALMRFRSNESYALDVEKHFNDEENFMTELEVVGSLNLNQFYNRGLRQWVVTRQVFIDDYKIVE